MENELNKVEPYKAVPRSYSDAVTPAGSPFTYRHKLSIDKVTGERIAEPGERIDLQATINSYLASTDIASIVARYEAGDETVLNVNNGGFTGDVTMLPKDINDIVGTDGLFQKTLDSFNKLPDDVKSIFNNDPSQFYKHVLDNTVFDLLSSKKPVNTVNTVEEKKGDAE